MNNSIYSKCVVGVLSSVCLFVSASVFAEPGKVVGIEVHNWIWSNTGTKITFDPDSGGPNVVCDYYSGESRGMGSSVGGSMALVAMMHDAQLDNVDFTVLSSGPTCNAFEISIADGGNQAFFHIDSNNDAYEFTTINGVSCFTPTAGQGDKIAMAMANGSPMTATCTYNPWVNENILEVIF
jgi:hypothetical protein